MTKILFGYCDMADIVVKESVKSSSPARGAAEGQIGIAGIVKKPRGGVITIKSIEEAQAKLGGYLADSTVLYGINVILKKVGQATIHVSPVTHRTDPALANTEVGAYGAVTVKTSGGSPVSIFNVKSTFMGLDANKYSLVFSDQDAVKNTYTVTVKYDGVAIGAPIKNIKNSTLVDNVVVDDLTFTMLINDDTKLPDTTPFTLAGGLDAHTNVASADYDTAINALKKYPLDFLIVDSTLVSNGQTATGLADAIKAVAYLNSPMGSTDAQAIAHRANFGSKNGRLLHPHMYVADPLTGGKKAIPIAYNAVANQLVAFREVGRRQVSAGEIYGKLDCLGLTHEPDGTLLADTGVDYAVTFDNAGACIWDATTLSNDVDWHDLNRIQLLNFVRKSLAPSLRPDLFKASDADVWEKVETRASGFMSNLFIKGELYSESGAESDAYFVQCDSGNNPRSEQLAKRMHVKVGYKDKQMIKWIILEIEVA